MKPASQNARSTTKKIKKDAAGQFVETRHGGKNNGVASAEPRVFSKDDKGDATFPLKQGSKGR